jgi:hypothetical protein
MARLDINQHQRWLMVGLVFACVGCVGTPTQGAWTRRLGVLTVVEQCACWL